LRPNKNGSGLTGQQTHGINSGISRHAQHDGALGFISPSWSDGNKHKLPGVKFTTPKIFSRHFGLPPLFTQRHSDRTAFNGLSQTQRGSENPQKPALQGTTDEHQTLSSSGPQTVFFQQRGNPLGAIRSGGPHTKRCCPKPPTRRACAGQTLASLNISRANTFATQSPAGLPWHLFKKDPSQLSTCDGFSRGKHPSSRGARPGPEQRTTGITQQGRRLSPQRNTPPGDRGLLRRPPYERAFCRTRRAHSPSSGCSPTPGAVLLLRPTPTTGGAPPTYTRTCTPVYFTRDARLPPQRAPTAERRRMARHDPPGTTRPP